MTFLFSFTRPVLANVYKSSKMEKSMKGRFLVLLVFFVCFFQTYAFEPMDSEGVVSNEFLELEKVYLQSDVEENLNIIHVRTGEEFLVSLNICSASNVSGCSSIEPAKLLSERSISFSSSGVEKFTLKSPTGEREIVIDKEMPKFILHSSNVDEVAESVVLEYSVEDSSNSVSFLLLEGNNANGNTSYVTHVDSVIKTGVKQSTRIPIKFQNETKSFLVRIEDPAGNYAENSFKVDSNLAKSPQIEELSLFYDPNENYLYFEVSDPSGLSHYVIKTGTLYLKEDIIGNVRDIRKKVGLPSLGNSLTFSIYDNENRSSEKIIDTKKLKKHRDN